MVELENVSEEFKMGSSVIKALDNINLKIKRGEFLSVIGTSGSGKSTLLNLIGGLLKPTIGKIIVDEIDISTYSDNEMANYRKNMVGFVFQSFNLIPTLTALENVEYPMIFSGISRIERLKRSEEVLEKLGLGDRLKHNPTELSGGEQQRVSIARAIINEPEIILADEPTGNLDSKTGKGIMDVLKTINEEMKRTLIVVTHDIYISYYSDRRVYLSDGKIVKIEEGKV
ncbi:MAG: ABC transporter ATP-binding protein [Actinobacteria bacterium]|nr:ABC transporter ATP-binding protein [Actinomycetota bacterium]